MSDSTYILALHMAVWKGCSPPLFHRILSMILSVNACDENGFTALMLAAIYNHLDMVISLLKYPGIDLNVRGSANYTALHFAVHFNNPAILTQLLSDDRVDTSLKEDDNGTPLKHAILNAPSV